MSGGWSHSPPGRALRDGRTTAVKTRGRAHRWRGLGALPRGLLKPHVSHVTDGRARVMANRESRASVAPMASPLPNDIHVGDDPKRISL